MTMPDLDDLMAAIVNGNLPEVWSLLDAPGATPAIFEGEEAMALSIACVHAGPHPNLEREGIVNALLRAGATPNLVSLMYSAGEQRIDHEAARVASWTARRRRHLGKAFSYPDKCETYDGACE